MRIVPAVDMLEGVIVAEYGFAFGLFAISSFSRHVYDNDPYSSSTKSLTELHDVRWFKIAATGFSGAHYDVFRRLTHLTIGASD
jgi:hypothetical protein